MNNWWIAALEHAGIWTREQAEHVSDSIKFGIHREKYTEAYNDLKDILSKGEFGVGHITTSDARVTALEAQVKLLTEQLGRVSEVAASAASKVDPKTVNDTDESVPEDAPKTPLAKETKTT
jgi:hypothetical protein